MKLQAFQKVLLPLKGKIGTVYDIGSGDQQFGRYVSNQLGAFKYVPIDIEFPKGKNPHILNEGIDCIFRQANKSFFKDETILSMMRAAATLHTSDVYVDLILLSMTVHHLTNDILDQYIQLLRKTPIGTKIYIYDHDVKGNDPQIVKILNDIHAKYNDKSDVFYRGRNEVATKFFGGGKFFAYSEHKWNAPAKLVESQNKYAYCLTRIQGEQNKKKPPTTTKSHDNKNNVNNILEQSTIAQEKEIIKKSTNTKSNKTKPTASDKAKATTNVTRAASPVEKTSEIKGEKEILVPHPITGEQVDIWTISDEHIPLLLDTAVPKVKPVNITSNVEKKRKYFCEYG